MRASPSSRTCSNRDRSRNPSATCYSVRSRTSPLRSSRDLPQFVGVFHGAGDGGTTTDENFVFGMVEDFKTRAAQHRFETRTVRNPPVGRIVGEAVLDEVHPRKVVENRFANDPTDRKST